MKLALLVALWVVGLAFIGFWWFAARHQERVAERDAPLTDPFRIFIGALTNFLDTLGIGSYATTTSIFKLKQTVADENIPGTLNVGHALPTVTEALIYITIVAVDPGTLVAMIAASVVGAWLGAGIVSRLPRRRVQIGMGIALLAAAGLMAGKQFGWFPGGGDLLALQRAPLAVGLIGNAILGALMTLGIGLYAPCMILVSLLGMNPKAAFPIMMGSCAFLMPTASVRFVRSRRYDLRAAIGLTIGGVPAVIVAAYLIKELPLDTVRLLVIFVVVYTAAMMLQSAAASAASPREEG